MRKPLGNITRGTTNPNRLRRVDRYIAALPIATKPGMLAVDLGFGASPITAIELLARLREKNATARVVGIEIDRERVERGKPYESDALRFIHGGFETPLPQDFAERADLIRAFNVLRQYEDSEVQSAWVQMQSRLSDDGILVEGTCDEIGRVSCWVTLDKSAPLSLTISLRLLGLDEPSKVAERLPKVLIHRNVEGEKIYEYLRALDTACATTLRSGCSHRCSDGWPCAATCERSVGR